MYFSLLTAHKVLNQSDLTHKCDTLPTLLSYIYYLRNGKRGSTEGCNRCLRVIVSSSTYLGSSWVAMIKFIHQVFMVVGVGLNLTPILYLMVQIHGSIPPIAILFTPTVCERERATYRVPTRFRNWPCFSFITCKRHSRKKP